MDIQYLVSSASEDKLKCFICKNYLSYFPISTCANGQSFCGRCTPPEGATCHQDDAFETLCQLVKFPCRYHSEGCLEELVPKEVPKHEQTCDFRKFKCVSTKPQPCNWSGVLPALLNHCQDKHSNVFLKKGEFEIDLTRSEEHEYFMEHDDRVIIFAIKYDQENKTLVCALYSNEYQSVDGTSCQLSVRFGNTTISQELPLTTYEAQKFSELFLHPFCSTENNKLVLGKICIGEKQTMNNENGQNLKGNLDNSKMISALTCCRCRTFATPPFYRQFGDMTGTVNIICSKCKQDSYNKCCKNSRLTGDVYDGVLAEILTFTKFPCPYQQNGCSYSGAYQEMRTHYKFCQYMIGKCILDSSCSWSGPVKTLVDHILIHHQEKFVPSGVETEMTSEDGVTKCQFIKVHEFVFKLSYRVNIAETSNTQKQKRRFMWSVQMMGDYKEKFKYQIDVNDEDRGGRVSLWQFCTPVTEENSVFVTPGQFCYLEVEQLCMLKTEDKDIVTKKEEVVVSDMHYQIMRHRGNLEPRKNVLTITFKVKIYK